jgi:hypothetical protein
MKTLKKRLLAIPVALAGIGLLVAGVERLRQLLAWNTVKPEMLDGLVGETIGWLFFGCVMIICCLVYWIG